MFKVECFTEDKDVGVILRVLAETGKAFGVTSTYVVNAVKAAKSKKEAPEIKAETDGDTANLWLGHMRKMRMSQFRFGELANFCTTIGMTKGAASSLLGRLSQRGLITKIDRGLYKLVETGAE